MKIKTQWGVFNVLHCPCCGGKKFYIGHEFSTTMAILCWRHEGGCGLGVLVDFPNKLTKPISIKAVEKMCLTKAVKIWNKRTKANENKSSKSN